MYQLPEPDLFERLPEGSHLVDRQDDVLSVGGRPLCALLPGTIAAVADATAAARANLGAELEKFARNTLHYLDADKDFLLDPTDVPAAAPVASRRAGMPSWSCAGKATKKTLRELRPYLRDVRPVLIAVDGAADALLALGHRPDIILGDMDSVSDDALRCGAQLIVHAYSPARQPSARHGPHQTLGLDCRHIRRSRHMRRCRVVARL